MVTKITEVTERESEKAFKYRQMYYCSCGLLGVPQGCTTDSSYFKKTSYLCNIVKRYMDSRELYSVLCISEHVVYFISLFNVCMNLGLISIFYLFIIYIF